MPAVLTTPRRLPGRAAGPDARAASATSSSAAADLALRQLLDCSPRFGSDAPRLPGGSVVPAAAGGGLGRLVGKALAVVIVAGVVAGGTTLALGGRAARYPVAGTVRVANAPLANAILEFELKKPKGGAQAFATVIHTDAAGGFHRDASAGLPPGTYSVVVKPRLAAVTPARSRPNAFPPLSIDIDGPARSLDLVIRN